MTDSNQKALEPEKVGHLTKKCPYCAEEIRAEAIKCKHCGETLNKKIELEKTMVRGSPSLYAIGILLFLGGLAYGIYHLSFFDTSVEVPKQEILGQVLGGGRVHNIGLMQEKQTGILLGFGVAVLGLILALVGKYGNLGSISGHGSTNRKIRKDGFTENNQGAEKTEAERTLGPNTKYIMLIIIILFLAVVAYLVIRSN